MSQHHAARPPTRRQPLSDTTSRTNNTPYTPPTTRDKIPHHESLRPDGQLQNRAPAHAAGRQSPAANARLSAISRDEYQSSSNRNSQISTTSTNASGGAKLKVSIGPWRLGKTLGQGSTARVRQAMHNKTGQLAAVKIVQKKAAHLTQAGSLAELSKKDAKLPDVSDGFRRMPYGIEREVAIMKMIEHPHIMRLYDIWENRTEIYLVLEYVDDGELFQHISNKGRLSEEEAVKYFRQILSGIDYCHSYNICHRDLKPENILLNKQGEVRIADFGMAALQQTAEHRLQTSCGSPHYAAPEVVRGGPYHGNKVDIWSLGVILFAMLSGHLPFDCPSMTRLLQAIQRGKYIMPKELSAEAQNLIHNMLQCDARRRIPIDSIWQHPLMRKYDYLDNYGRISSNIERLRDCGRPVNRKSDIDKDLLRHLRSMWHSLEEAQIVKLLLNEEANDQKLFYALLLRHRNRQLENYAPDVCYSKSDYHHGDHPLPLEESMPDIPKSSTRQFIQSKGKGHSRQISRFTVISNISRGKSSNHSRSGSNAPTEGGQETMHSYDPYNHARTNHAATATLANAKVVVHKGKASLHEGVPPMPTMRPYADELVGPARYTTRSSLASSTRSQASSQKRVAMANKRGIIFPHNQRHSGGNLLPKASVPTDRHSRFSEVTDFGGDTLHAVQARTGTSQVAQGETSSATTQDNTNKRVSHVWKNDVRKLSSSLAKDCDTAFYRASGTTVSGVGTARSSAFESLDVGTPASSLHDDILSATHFDQDGSKRSSRDREQDRPLPARPERSASTRAELEDLRRIAMTQRITGNGEFSASHLERMVTHIDELLEPSPHKRPEVKGRRTASAPVRTQQQNEGHYGTLQAINEASFEESPRRERMSDYDEFLARERSRNSNRYSSAPETYGSTSHVPKNLGRVPELSKVSQTPAPSSPLPARPTAPLNIRKRSSQTAAPLSPLVLSSDITGHETSGKRPDINKQHSNASQSTAANRFTYSEDLSDPPISTTNTTRKKKTNWFGRTSSNEVEDSTLPADVTAPSQSSSDRTVRPLHDLKVSEPAPKKGLLGLGRFFKKNSKEAASSSVFQIQEGDDLSITSIDDQSRRAKMKQTEVEPRQIATQRNWWARLFHVKPAKRYLAFTVSKHRARRELANLLREWKKYGVRDVIVDSQRNMIFARIGPKNYLHLQEVSFACEILTVIEHGRKYPLSIVRFTQEKGAASSFYKVIETLEQVLKSRGMLVTDEGKKSMMIKTLQSFDRSA